MNKIAAYTTTALIITLSVFSGCTLMERITGRGGFPEAEEHCDKLKGERKYECYYRFAEAYFEKEEFEKAAASYEKALKPYEGYRKIALSYLLQGNMEQGDMYCEKLRVKSAYDQQQCYITAANMAKNRAESAFYNEKFDNSATYYLRSGVVFHRARLYDKSIDSYLRAAKLHMFQLADVRIELQQYQLKNEVLKNMEGVKETDQLLKSYEGLTNPSNVEEGLKAFSKIEKKIDIEGIKDEKLKKYVQNINDYKSKMNSSLASAVRVKIEAGDERPEKEIRNNLAFRMLCLQL